MDNTTGYGLGSFLQSLGKTLNPENLMPQGAPDHTDAILRLYGDQMKAAAKTKATGSGGESDYMRTLGYAMPNIRTILGEQTWEDMNSDDAPTRATAINKFTALLQGLKNGTPLPIPKAPVDTTPKQKQQQSLWGKIFGGKQNSPNPQATPVATVINAMKQQQATPVAPDSQSPIIGSLPTMGN